MINQWKKSNRTGDPNMAVRNYGPADTTGTPFYCSLSPIRGVYNWSGCVFREDGPGDALDTNVDYKKIYALLRHRRYRSVHPALGTT
jgi:hypothetical protein